MKYNLKKAVAPLFLAAYLAVVGIMLMGSMNHMEMNGCPFMPGEQGMCQMSVTDHISAWQGMFMSVEPTFFILSILLAIVFVFVAWQWYPPPKLSIMPAALTRRRDGEIIPLFQLLLSDGLLNPKIP
ncbi:MAG: hypothetical protein JST90_07125 [Bacteroidetes bacterium]|nr:hypothetical protein [Bacteroidota bacterium]